MDALIEVSASELTEELFSEIKSLAKNVGNGEITIKVTNPENSLFRTETSNEYWARLREAKQEIKEGKGVVFSMDELEQYVHKITGK